MSSGPTYFFLAASHSPPVLRACRVVFGAAHVARSTQHSVRGWAVKLDAFVWDLRSGRYRCKNEGGAPGSLAFYGLHSLIRRQDRVGYIPIVNERCLVAVA
jgi:hypothetical protein